MSWLREMCRALFDALLEHWRSPRRTRLLGGDDELQRKVQAHIRLRSKESFGGKRSGSADKQQP